MKYTIKLTCFMIVFNFVLLIFSGLFIFIFAVDYICEYAYTYTYATGRDVLTCVCYITEIIRRSTCLSALLHARGRNPALSITKIKSIAYMYLLYKTNSNNQQ